METLAAAHKVVVMVGAQTVEDAVVARRVVEATGVA